MRKFIYVALDEDVLEIRDKDGNKVGEFENCFDGVVVFSATENTSFEEDDLAEILALLKLYKTKKG